MAFREKVLIHKTQRNPDSCRSLDLALKLYLKITFSYRLLLDATYGLNAQTLENIRKSGRLFPKTDHRKRVVFSK